MKIAFLTRYDKQRASSRVRAYQYGPHLAALGIESRFLPWANRSRHLWPAYVAGALQLGRWADVVVLQKPFQPPWLVDALARRAPALVVDVDDAVWEPVTTASTQRAAQVGRRLDHALRRSAVAIAGSEYLAASIRDRCPGVDVRVLPSPVEIHRFGTKQHTQHHPIIVGWIGSPENLADLEVCKRALSRAVTGGLIRVHIVTSGDATPSGLPAHLRKWCLESEPTDIAGFDVGIMPLRDTPRTRGRCGFKAIEYMAAGLPVIASPVPGPSEVVEDCINGYVVATERAWGQRLQELASDAPTRQRLGSAGRHIAETRFSADLNAVRLAKIVDPGAHRSTTIRGDRASGSAL